MSALPDVPDDFYQWVLDHLADLEPWLGPVGLSGSVSPGDFLPRAVYGPYLEDLLARSEADAAPGVVLKRSTADIVDVQVVEGIVRVTGADGARSDFDAVVLAIGNLPPSDPAIDDPAFYRTSLYYDRPWRHGAVDDVDPAAGVLLIGTGLTMVDLATTLIENGHTGKIYAISRRGLLPSPHAAYAAGSYAVDPASIPSDLHGLVRWFRAEVQRAVAAGSNWRAVVDGFRPYTQTVWAGLPDVEKRRFLRHVRAVWEVSRHRVPPVLHQKLRAAVADGQLEILTGRIRGYRRAGPTVNVTVQKKDGTVVDLAVVSRVINCTGPTSNFRKMAAPLLAALLEHGYITPDPLHLGFNTDDDGGLLDAAGRSPGLLYTLGPPRKGSLWETTAVPEIRAQAQKLALALLRRFDAAGK
jgi:uncharacterized NAD(P)/FAD-binding protein YdhS